MKMPVLVHALMVFGLCAASCNNISPKKDTKADSAKFFPLREYLLEQSEKAKESGNIKYKIVDDGEKKDTLSLNEDQFKQLTKQFIECDLAADTKKPFYTENIFFDESTNSYTFNYTTNNNLPVKSIDVLVNPASQQVKRVFINKVYNSKDSVIIEKLSWKTNSNFSINRIVQYNNQPLSAQKTTVSWGDNN